MADDCIVKKIIKEFIHDETRQMVDELKPLIREIIAEELDRRFRNVPGVCIPDMTAAPSSQVSAPVPVVDTALPVPSRVSAPVPVMDTAPAVPSRVSAPVPVMDTAPAAPSRVSAPVPVMDTAPAAPSRVSAPVPVMDTAPPPLPIPDDSQAPSQSPADELGGLYIYGIIDSPVDIQLGDVGIDSALTYTIPYRDIAAIVHQCTAEPYKSEETDTVNQWISSHQNVLDIAADRFDLVLPFGFDTIITSSDSETALEVFQTWISEEYERIREKLNKIQGKKEYGVQVFYHPSMMSDKVLADSDAIRSLKEEMETKGPGVAYMFRKKMEQAVEHEMSVMVDADFSDFFGQISELSDDTRVEKVKRTMEKDRVMMMNISCLVTSECYTHLGDVLEIIDNMKEYSVRFTGPWPPYSFV